MEQLGNIKEAINIEKHYERTRQLIQELQSTLQASKRLTRDQERICRAFDLMLLAHFNQKDRPDGQPYVNHPLDVTLHLVNEYKVYDADMLVASLLHDTVEDNPKSILIWEGKDFFDGTALTNQALLVIAKQFGENVSQLVDQLTNPDFDAEVKRLGKDNEDKNAIKVRLYREHFEKIYHDNVWAFAIKMSDFSQNALHIDVLKESPRKGWLRRKYGPVILMVAQRLAELEDEEHPLFDARDKISKNLLEVYERDYLSAT